MASFAQRINFWISKRNILNPNNKEGFNGRVQYAYELARTMPNEFLLDYDLVTFLYESIKIKETAVLVIPIIHTLLKLDPRGALANKNFMLSIRRLAVSGNREDSQQAVKIITERLTAKQCLYSNNFMDALVCIASFDEDKTVSKILDELEKKEPSVTVQSEDFYQARKNNYESLEKIEDKIFDLSAEEQKEQVVDDALVSLNNSDDNILGGTTNDGADIKYRNLFAVPTDKN